MVTQDYGNHNTMAARLLWQPQHYTRFSSPCRRSLSPALNCTSSLIGLLFLGGRKEANHLHRLLQPFEVMTQVFLILYLKVLLHRKIIGLAGVDVQDKMKAKAQNGKTNMSRTDAIEKSVRIEGNINK